MILKYSNILMIESTTSILYAIRYLLTIRDGPIGNIHIQSIFYDERIGTVKIGLPECKRIVEMTNISYKNDFEALAVVLKEIAEISTSEPIQMNLLTAAELCKTKNDVFVSF